MKTGEVKCDKCNGKGKLPAEEIPQLYIYFAGEKVKCPKCHGAGKLDWVENITGKKGKPPPPWVSG